MRGRGVDRFVTLGFSRVPDGGREVDRFTTSDFNRVCDSGVRVVDRFFYPRFHMDLDREREDR